MTIEERINSAKEEFQKMFANNGKTPFQMGITAAYQRASLYAPGQDNSDIRLEWENQLKEITEKYKDPQTRDLYRACSGTERLYESRIPRAFK